MFSPTKGPAPPPQAAAAAKKRRRDISSFGNFKHHMYMKGMQSFHATIESNPVIMYPPTGIEEAREQLKFLGMLADTPAAPIPAVAAGDGSATPTAADEQPAPPQRREPVDIDQFLRELEDPSAQQSNEHPPPPSSPQADKSAAPAAAITPGGQQQLHRFLESSEGRVQTEKANYHRTQLNALVAQFYDFNHTQFVKLPVRQTVELLLRCGREAYAHLADFENEERNRKARILAERVSSKRQRDETTTVMNEGRSDYYDAHLRQAEVQEQSLKAAMDISQHDGHGNDEEDFEDYDIVAHIQEQQLDDTVMYSMFPGAGDDDEEFVAVNEATEAATIGLDRTPTHQSHSDNDITTVSTGPLESTVEFNMSSAPSETLRVAATNADSVVTMTETLYAGTTEASREKATE
jgi:hypothetical protein